jgi:hypothetical protein
MIWYNFLESASFHERGTGLTVHFMATCTARCHSDRSYRYKYCSCASLMVRLQITNLHWYVWGWYGGRTTHRSLRLKGSVEAPRSHLYLRYNRYSSSSSSYSTVYSSSTLYSSSTWYNYMLCTLPVVLLHCMYFYQRGCHALHTLHEQDDCPKHWHNSMIPCSI